MKVTRGVMAADDAKISEWTGTLEVGTHGNSMILRITPACRLLDLEKGDAVEVTVRRK